MVTRGRDKQKSRTPRAPQVDKQIEARRKGRGIRDRPKPLHMPSCCHDEKAAEHQQIKNGLADLMKQPGVLR